MALLELQGIKKGFGRPGARTEVLGGIDLSIEKGEFVSIVGYSGAGKTTLISIIAGLIRPDAGRVLLNGKEIREPGPDRAIVFQNYSLLPWMTVYENVALAVDQVFADKPAAWRREQVERHVDMVKLLPARGKKPHELSGGMRQRVSVARALAMEPEILLMDEPFGALDALTRASLQDELVRICEETHKTVVMITNDVEEGILLSDRILPMTPAPRAVLGPSFTVDVPHPRERRAMGRDPRCKPLRAGILEFLLGGARTKRQALVGATA